MAPLFFFGTPISLPSLFEAHALLPNDIHWVDGVHWRVHPDLASYFTPASEIPKSWLPSSWQGPAIFRGWNRVGQTVVEDAERSRFVRRGPRHWEKIDASTRCDGLLLNDDDAWRSTLEGWKILRLFDSTDACLAWCQSAGLEAPEWARECLDGALLTPTIHTSPIQIPYLPLSEQPHASFLPGSLSHASAHALSKWAETHPSDTMDDFVSRETQLNLSPLSGEQVDAIGLALAAIERRTPFLLGDQTGLGKGRVLAALAHWAQQHGLVPVFFTERATLFHDFWRDLEDVTNNTNPYAQTFVMHQLAKLQWPDGKAWTSPYTAKSRQEAVASGVLPSTCNLVVTTYSQFNRKDEKKIQFLKSIAPRALFIFDEAHVSTGQSRIREAVASFSKKAHACVYASATFGKDESHVAFYSSLLGRSAFLHDWAFWLSRPDAEPLRVSLSQRLVKQGVMARREQDLSQLTHTIFEPTPDAMAAIRTQADAFSTFFAGLLALQKDLQSFPVNPDLSSDPSSLFGGKLYRLHRLMLLFLSLPLMVDECIRLLQRGIKPVVVLETTLEQALKENEESELGDLSGWSDFGAVLAQEIDGLVQGWVVPLDKPSGQDVLAMAERAKKWLHAHFSHLPPSPMDALIHQLKSHGHAFGEISGRQHTLCWNVDSSTWEHRPFLEERTQNIRQFNSGGLDGLVVTRAGCAGISLHASHKFKDQRPRELIEWQVPRNVAERIQFFGRVYRKGQVVPSGIRTLHLGLPSEARQQASQNKKLQQLSQFTVGRTGFAALQSHVSLDYLERPLASAWAQRLLLFYPSIAHALGLGVDGQRPQSWMDRLFSRLPLLSLQKQEKMLSFWDQAESKLFPETHTSDPRTSPVLGQWRFVADTSIELRLSNHAYEPPIVQTDSFSGWSDKMLEWATSYPSKHAFFTTLSTVVPGGTVRWHDRGRRSTAAGCCLSVWLPPDPFAQFWQGASLLLWSPVVGSATWVHLHDLMTDDAFQLIPQPFPLATSIASAVEQQRSFLTIRGPSEFLMLWKTHHRVGRWDACAPNILVLPPHLSIERVSKMSLPLPHPNQAIQIARSHPDRPLVLGTDMLGQQISFLFTSTGQFLLTWVGDAPLDDGPLISIAFRQYGNPKTLSDGSHALAFPPAVAHSVVFHLLGRGLVFGLPFSLLSTWQRTIERS